MHTTRKRLIVFCVLLVLSSFTATTSRAAEFFLRLTYLDGGTCNDTTFNVPAQASWNVPNGTTIREEEYFNGVFQGANEAPLTPSSGTDTGSFSELFPAQSNSYTFQEVWILRNPGAGLTLRASVTVHCALPANVITVRVSSSDGQEDVLFTDGRLNPDPEASVVLYCNGKTLELYRVIDSEGRLIGTFSEESLAKYKPGSQHILVKRMGDVRLFLLSSGEWQVNAPKPDGKDYVFRWKGCG